MIHSNDILYGSGVKLFDNKGENRYNIMNKNYKKLRGNKYVNKFIGKSSKSAKGINPAGKLTKFTKIGKFFNFSKIFFILIIICTIAYLSLQIQKNKYAKKYVVALLVLFIFGLVGGLFIIKLPRIPPIFLIIKILFLGGTLVTFLILNILLGKNKF